MLHSRLGRLHVSGHRRLVATAVVGAFAATAVALVLGLGRVVVSRRIVLLLRLLRLGLRLRTGLLLLLGLLLLDQLGGLLLGLLSRLSSRLPGQRPLPLLGQLHGDVLRLGELPDQRLLLRGDRR